MKKRLIFAVMLLLAFGTLKAQDTINAPRKADTTFVNSNMSELQKLLLDLGVTLEQLSDSVDWEQFERDMEKWGAEMEKWGEKMEKWGERFEKKYDKDRGHEYRYRYSENSGKSKNDDPQEKHPKRKSLLLDANWNGFEAGLNMLFNTPVGDNDMEIRPLRSWYFGFNIADVGIAFNRKHTAGLFTGVGLGWNNFSWNNSVEMYFDPTDETYYPIPVVSDQSVKNTKYGALFLEVPLMFEFRPTRRMYIDAGVTGGLRIAQWNRVKFADRSQYKNYYIGTNQFKLDASLRIGGDDFGFFANYGLLPFFAMPDTDTHTLSFGFSLNF